MIGSPFTGNKFNIKIANLMPLIKHNSSSSSSQDVRFSGGQSQGSLNPVFQHKIPKFISNSRQTKLSNNQSLEELNGEQISSVIVMTQKKPNATHDSDEQRENFQSKSNLNKLVPTQQISLSNNKKTSSNSKGKKVSKVKKPIVEPRFQNVKSNQYNSAIKILDKNIQIIDQERSRQLKSSQNTLFRSNHKQMTDKIKSCEKLKLSPKVEQKFRRHDGGKSAYTKHKPHKERLISEKRGRNMEANQPNIFQISLLNDKSKDSNYQGGDSKERANIQSYQFKAARLQQSCEDLRRVNDDSMTKEKDKKAGVPEVTLIMEKPKKKQFKSFIDSYISEARKGSDESKNNISRDSSFSTELNTSTKILKNQVQNNMQMRSKLQLFQQKRTSVTKTQLQQVKKPGQQSQDNERSISKLREADYLSGNQHELKIEEVITPTQVMSVSRNLDERSGKQLSAQQPLQTLVKTKFQYFNAHQKKVSSPPPQVRMFDQIPLEIEIPTINPKGMVTSPSGIRLTVSKTAKNSNVRQLNSANPTNRSSRKLIQRSSNQQVKFQFPPSSQNSPIDTAKNPIDSPTDRKNAPQEFETHENSYFLDDLNSNIISARALVPQQILHYEPNVRHIKHKSMHTSDYQYIQRQDSVRIINYCQRGCQCFTFHQKDSICCPNAQNWLQLAYQTEYKEDSYQKTYESIYFSSSMNTEQDKDIRQDIERTFSSTLYFMETEVRESLLRVLKAYASYEQEVGYVQGMSFIAGALFYHAGEVATFWLLIALMDQYSLKDVFKYNLPGVMKHEHAIQKLGQIYLEDLFTHLDSLEVKLQYFAAEWIMSIFLNFIPLEINHLYLNKFFEEKWAIFYRVAISLLKYYEKKILKLNDFAAVIGQIKQAREGCEYLMPQLSHSQSSISMNQSTELHKESFVYQQHLQMWDTILDMAINNWESMNEEYLWKYDNSNRNSVVKFQETPKKSKNLLMRLYDIK